MIRYCIFGLMVCFLAFSTACSTDEGEGNDWDLSENNGSPLDAGVDVEADVTDDVEEDVEADAEDASECQLRVPNRHRTSAQSCDDQRDIPEPEFVGDEGEYAECTTHADCTEGDNGRCVRFPRRGWACTYDECFDDADCGAGNACECGAGWASDHNVCMRGNCQTDSDCGDNGYCSPSFDECGDYSGVVGYFCHTCEDECTDDSDCGGTEGYGDPYCMYNQSVGYWTCSASVCVG